MTENHFECAECGKEFEGKKFPYENKWVYLHSMNLKTEEKSKVSLKDIQFCSLRCAVAKIKDYFSK